MRALPGIRRRVVIGLIASMAVLTSACAAGQHAPTSEESPAIDASGGTIGHLQVHQVAVAAPPNGPSYAAGQSASLMFTVVNTGQTADSITAITTSAATGIEFVDATNVASVFGTGSATPTAPASSSAAAAALSPIDVAAGSRVSFGVTSSYPALALTGLTAPLYGGNQISVTFTFARAGTLTIAVPVALTSSPGGLIVSDSGTSSP